ncbi:unnamed protein product [Vitrella brassicaformis CCMP3155]|uniref:Dynamin N-terminal domain-containing protein n=2 Tax=Vitrella brassicaformis TaxID=1169539 RepID=A0A0G4GCD5_VITBC|nr:unnamed protein product [Vitrella brassicaformis CCMP3155]|eukprot:CEM26963.1 unnamed protein product [Vitrella brassicaformis CCMP3155]
MINTNTSSNSPRHSLGDISPAYTKSRISNPPPRIPPLDISPIRRRNTGTSYDRVRALHESYRAPAPVAMRPFPRDEGSSINAGWGGGRVPFGDSESSAAAAGSSSSYWQRQCHDESDGARLIRQPMSDYGTPSSSFSPGGERGMLLADGEGEGEGGGEGEGDVYRGGIGDPAMRSFTLDEKGFREAQRLLQMHAHTTDPMVLYRLVYDLLRLVGLGFMIPRIVTIGQQSDGKTTFLEAMLRLCFGYTRNGAAATKGPVRIDVKNDESSPTPRCQLNQEHIRLAAIQGRMRELMEHRSLSKEETHLEISYSGAPNLMCVDLPGIVQETGDTTREDVELTMDVVRHYVRHSPNDLYLVFKRADVDPGTWPIHDFIQSLGLHREQTIVACTRAENFLRENRVIYKTELLKLIKQKRVHDCSGEPIPMYFVELHNLSDQEKALPFAERTAVMEGQLAARRLDILDRLNKLENGAATDEDTTELYRYFDVESLEAHLNATFRRLLLRQLHALKSSLTSLLNELTSRHQVMTRQMEKIAPLTLGDLIERIVDLLDDTAQKLFNGEHPLMTEAFIAQHGARLEDDLGHGEDLARRIFRQYDTSRPAELSSGISRVTTFDTKLITRLAMNRVCQFLKEKIDDLEPELRCTKDYLLNKLGAVRGVLDSYSVKSMLPELVRHTTRGPLTQLAFLSAATAAAVLQRVLQAALELVEKRLLQDPHKSHMLFLLENTSFVFAVQKACADHAVRKAAACAKAMVQDIHEQTTAIRFGVLENIYSVVDAFERRRDARHLISVESPARRIADGSDGSLRRRRDRVVRTPSPSRRQVVAGGDTDEESGKVDVVAQEATSCLVYSVRDRTNERQKQLNIVHEGALPEEMIYEEVRTQFHIVKALVAVQLQVKMYVYLFQDICEGGDDNTEGYPFATLSEELKSSLLYQPTIDTDDTHGGDFHRPPQRESPVRKRTDSDYLRDFGLDSMQSQLAQRIQATAQELAYVREALKHLGRLMVAMQTAPIDFFRLHINRRCAGDTDN